MVTHNELVKESEFLGSFHTILQTYEEIAATRMTRARSSVLASRAFALEVNTIFQQVKSSYKAKIVAIMKKKKITDPSKLTFSTRNGKTVYIFISANTRLYGNIINRTYDLFINTYKKAPSDILIIGKIGVERFNAEKIKANMQYFDFPDDKVDEESLKKITEYILQYEKIIVFYEQFSSVVKQSPYAINISGDLLPWQQNAPQINYFFEPSLEKILAFFEKAIFGSVFKQTILESELAKFAARMVSLNQSADRTQQKLSEVNLAKIRARHQNNNKKQLEKFASIRLWQ
jgi:ATP synthase F1 gamma subunit